ncbi:MAG TPA: AsmA-like C-terminal domain-containing protein, partial [Candidatus Deferrimicrobiaceae bacterium]|nr:AsmA-like C-terminal domain-containing protein [Candidatus Deferrimicrobiaceae bacterium]
GFAYNSLTIKGEVKDGKFGVRWSRLDAASMNLTATGEYDFLADEINLTVLASPLKTIDTIIRKIPVISYILRGSLVAVPVQVTGKRDDPTVFVLSPTAIGSEVLGIFERTLKAPIRLFQPKKY